MTKKAAALERLAAFLKNEPEADEDQAIAAELAGESDRAALILIASRLDDALVLALANLLRRDLSKEEKKRIFDFQGPLGTFSARIYMAYALRVIDAEERRQLDVLREIRNACAHSRRALSLETRELKDAAALLFSDRKFPDGAIPRTAMVLHCFKLEKKLMDGVTTDLELLRFLQSDDA